MNFSSNGIKLKKYVESEFEDNMCVFTSVLILLYATLLLLLLLSLSFALPA